jgi:ribosomal protein L11 methyltransferase
MNNHVEIKIKNITGEKSEILIAELNELGFDGFEEGENLLVAFIEEEKFDEDELKQVTSTYHLSYEKNIIQQKNWNEEWEKNFAPVILDDFVAIRADFHQPIKTVQHEIIITPKMSFGTGHHATTHLMIQQMREMDFKNRTVFDFGTGTGILAILSEKLGAKNIVAIDNDEWSINNAKENIQRNSCKNIQLQLSNAPPGEKKFDVVLANINKNIILEYLKGLKNLMLENAQLLVCGLLIEDEHDVIDESIKQGLKLVNTISRGKWISIKFIFENENAC